MVNANKAPGSAELCAKAELDYGKRHAVHALGEPMLTPAAAQSDSRPGPRRERDLRRPVRPRELQDPLNLYLYHPLAWQLARVLSRTRLTPNMVSVIGGLCVVAAAVAYSQPWWPVSALLGLALHMTWHVVDGADGDLARLTGRASPFGEMVDGICDYASHIVLYFVLIFILKAQIGNVAWAWGVIAGISHIVQSNHVEVQRRSYQWWVYGVPWLKNTRRKRDPGELRGGAAGLADLYLRLASGLTPYAQRIDTAVDEANGNPVRLAQIADTVRSEAPPLLRIVKLLGPNPRALVLGASMLLGTPLWYFAYQAIVLNMMLVWSVTAHNAAAKRVAARIGASA